MSASPANGPSRADSTTPAGGPPRPTQRRKAPVSIFAQKKKPVKKPAPTEKQNAQRPMTNGDSGPSIKPTADGARIASTSAEEEKNYEEYPIFVSKDALVQGLHHHAMKLQGRPANPYEPSDFTRPLHLHRRYARDQKFEEQSDVASGVDDKERELIKLRRAERQAEREANQALIAPTGAEKKQPTRQKAKKKVEEVWYDEHDEKQKARRELRYEEARPWHLEDFDGKNVWIGSYEEPLSHSSVMFEIGELGFRMLPVEKWYRFIQTGRVNAMDSEAVEKHMAKKQKMARWQLGTQAAKDEERKQASNAKKAASLAAERRAYEDDEPLGMKREEYQADVDEIDFEFNDEFQDDDEGFVFGDEQDDEAKDTAKKVREEMRSANLGGTGVKDEDKDWDAEEQKEKQAELDEKRRTKRLRRQLIKKERKNEYDSESDRGEFSEDSETEESEEERERLEEERKAEDARKLNGDKSGTSTRGTNTPNGRSEKRDSSRLGLKRPIDAEASEPSGNESSRKKAKGANGTALLSINAARVRVPSGYGSGSETDTSRVGRQKIRLKNSPPGSPSAGGSRQGSPSSSRAQSPQRKLPPFPTLDEVRNAIPADGIHIPALVQLFKSRVLTRQQEFIALVKQAGKQHPENKKILPKPLTADGSKSPA